MFCLFICTNRILSGMFDLVVQMDDDNRAKVG
jgi:hypothetical protein